MPALSALVLSVLALSASGCSDTETPTNPTGIPDVAGSWTGTYRIRTCTDTIAGAPGPVCGPLTGTSAPMQPIRLGLQQTGDQVVGSLDFSGWYVRSLVVSGMVQQGGAILLTGSTSATDPTCPTVQSRLALTIWTSTLNRARDGITGDFRISGNVRTTGCVFSEFAIEADTLQLTKQ